MTVPAGFLSAIQAKEVTTGYWLEIEGIPYGYGTFPATAAFFAGRAAADQFLGIKSFLEHPDPPKGIDQKIDTLEGGALTMGQTEFELVDKDGTITQWAGIGYLTHRLYLATELAYDSNLISFFGNPAAYAAGQYIYIGTETIKIGAVVGNTFTGCLRGQFRSKPQDFGKGFPIGERPYTMAMRRCWYNQAAASGQGRQSLVGLDANRAVRFSGTLKNFHRKDNSYTTFVLEAVSIDAELNRECFRNMRSFKLNLGGGAIMDGAGADGSIQVRGWPGYGANAGCDSIPNVSTLLYPTALEKVLIKIDDEIFLGTVGDSGGNPNRGVIRLELRALFGTEPKAHHDGAVVNELIPVIANDVTASVPGQSNSALAIRKASKFSSLPNDQSPYAADHPLIILLQLLLSTGNGNNWPGGVNDRNYDVLPKDYGMGIDYSRIDIAGWEAAASEEPQLRFGGFIERAPNFITFMRNMLQMAGYYFFSTLGDKVSVRLLRPPFPDVTSQALNDNTGRIRKFKTGWDANWAQTIRDVTFKFGWDISDHSYKRVVIFTLANADVYSKGLARSIEIECPLLYPGGSNIRGEPPFTPFDVDQWLLNRKDFFQSRYSRPPPVIRERVSLDFIDVNIGDLVIVDHGQLPSTSTGAVGLTQEIGEVITKSIEDKSQTIVFQILLTGYALGNYRFVAPSLATVAVLSGDPGSGDITWALDPNTFSAPFGPTGQPQTDGRIEDNNGILQDTFGPTSDGSSVWVWKGDCSMHKDALIVGDFNPASGQIRLQANGGDFTDLGATPDDVAFVFITYPGENVSRLQTFGDANPLPKLYAFGLKSDDSYGNADDIARYFPI